MTEFKTQKRYEQKQKDKGFIRVSAWIPADKRDALSEFAYKLRKKAVQP